MKNLKEQFEKKVLNIDNSIEKHEVTSYTAYHYCKRGETKQQAFIRLYPGKITMALPFDEIKEAHKNEFKFQDNTYRYPRHELQTKCLPLSQLSQKCLSRDFIKLVRKAFLNIKSKLEG